MAYYCTQQVARDGPAKGEILTVYGLSPASWYCHEVKASWLHRMLGEGPQLFMYRLAADGWWLKETPDGTAKT